MSGIVHIMGIVNLTEDSFYAGSRTAAADALARAQQMWADGATVVDLGACSTRPGAPQPSLEEEWARLEPALREMAGHCPSGNSVRFARQCPAISIDTYRSEIVRRAYEIIGPFMVNPYVAMHMRGTPETMQQFTQYKDLLEDIKAYFRDFALKATDAGIADWLLDPGFGFSKTLEQNWELLRQLEELQELGRPILVGVSRKSMLYKALGITPEEAMPATQVVQYAALERGARWLRVHDVAEAARTAQLWSLLHQV